MPPLSPQIEICGDPSAKHFIQAVSATNTLLKGERKKCPSPYNKEFASVTSTLLKKVSLEVANCDLKCPNAIRTQWKK